MLQVVVGESFQRQGDGEYWRLFYCLIASILVHLSLGFSGEFFSNPSVAEVGPRRIEAVLKGGNVGPQIHLTQSDGEVSSSEELSNAGFNDAEYSGADTEAAEPGKSVRVEAQSGVIDVARYYVRSELSQPPSVINDVVLGAPPTNIGFAWSLRLRLYLSESGIVDRLVVEDSTAPKHVEEDAIEQFRSALYSPGMIHGQKVKSQLLILVTEPN